jgi:hypothetical protein
MIRSTPVLHPTQMQDRSEYKDMWWKNVTRGDPCIVA